MRDAALRQERNIGSVADAMQATPDRDRGRRQSTQACYPLHIHSPPAPVTLWPTAKRIVAAFHFPPASVSSFRQAGHHLRIAMQQEISNERPFESRTTAVH